MEFRKRGARLNPRLNGDRKGELFPYSLQFYQLPPTENISLSEFETFAIERLKLLKAIENLGVSYVKHTDDYNKKLESELRKLKFPFHLLQDDPYDQRRKDYISHFILRLAYCQSEDLRRWFIQQEMDLFKFRFVQLKNNKVQEFLKLNDLEFVAISEEEKNMHQKDLIDSTHSLSSVKMEDVDFYKVPFQAALDLVRPRKVFLSQGFAFIPSTDIVAIVQNDFRVRLSKALALRSAPLDTWLHLDTTNFHSHYPLLLRKGAVFCC
ncbi:DNA primase large subunit isoform X2 [Mixophyes fleayi]|uniref:DNA primase large subunit isoform X2 n=1 Tax=Mixophyes fleayi TaxID=3061075 RepID=UPI003F4D7317